MKIIALLTTAFTFAAGVLAGCTIAGHRRAAAVSAFLTHMEALENKLNTEAAQARRAGEKDTAATVEDTVFHFTFLRQQSGF